MTNGSFYRGDEIVGLTLRRSFVGGRGEEQHALRAHPKRTTISFDGRTGRWRTGEPAGSAPRRWTWRSRRPAPRRGRGRVGLRGRLRAGPGPADGHADASYRHAFLQDDPAGRRLTGFVTTDDGAVSCDRPAPAVCDAVLRAPGRQRRGSVSVAPRELVLQFRQAAGRGGLVPRDDGSRLRRARAAASPRSASSLPRARFAAARGSRDRARRSRASAPAGRRGRAAPRPGRSSTTFAGWGARTLRLAPGVPASFSESLLGRAQVLGLAEQRVDLGGHRARRGAPAPPRAPPRAARGPA